MSINEITQLISSVGFPIVCTIALFYQLRRQEDQHAEEMKKLTEALNNNTLALQKLEIKLEEQENEN